MTKALFFLVFILVSLRSPAQILPKEGSMLNYAIVGISFPKEAHLGKYKVEIASGDLFSEDSFRRNIVQVKGADENRLLTDILVLGSKYTWRATWITQQNTVKKGPFHHFSTYKLPNADTSKFRLKIIKPSEQYNDHYYSVDAGGVLYDASGTPIWFLPDKNGLGSYVVDMEFTDDGTITFLYKKPYEINLCGDILWKVKKNGVVSGDTLGEFFHHEFTRLSNGHYMALGSQLLLCKTISTNDSTYIEVSKENGKTEKDGYRFGIFGTLIEYDKDGDVVWSWKSAEYMIGSDFDYYSGLDANLKYQPHDNSFFFDEKNKCIYVGFRNISRILKIDYPSGKLLATYGDRFKPGMQGTGEGILCGQHNIGRTQDGYLYVFNNNSCKHTDSLPTVVMLQEPVSPTDPMRKVWEYTCPVEQKAPHRYGSGGNVKEISDTSFFINMGSEYSKLMIVNRDKKILWSALPERFVETDKIWVSIHQYRANIISRAQLEKLIWAAENFGSQTK